MNKQGLENKISKKLAKLSKLLDETDKARVINSDDPETWNSDALYNLAENLKNALKLLEDQPIKDQYDKFGQPLYEDGLCSLVDSYDDE